MYEENYFFDSRCILIPSPMLQWSSLSFRLDAYICLGGATENARPGKCTPCPRLGLTSFVTCSHNSFRRDLKFSKLLCYAVVINTQTAHAASSVLQEGL